MLELGGAQRNTLYTAEHLDPQRFEVQLLAGPGGILDEEARKLAARHGIALGFIPSLIRPVRPFKDLAALFQIRKALKKFQPDILHTHSSKAGILGRLAGALAGVPVIIHTYHGFGFNKVQRPWVRIAFILADKVTARLSQALVFVANANRQEAKSLGIGRPEQYVLIRSGIKKPSHISPDQRAQLKKNLGIPFDAPLVTTIGPFKPQKNLIDFIRLAKSVYDLEPSARFLIIGDGEERPAYERLRKELGLEDKLFMPGWRMDAENLLAVSEVFAMTSLWEGLPRSLVEAMSLGLAVACYETDGITDLVRDGENGFLFKQGEIEPMARQINRVLKDEGMRRHVGQAATASVGKEFDIDQMVHQQEALYTDLLKTPH